MKQKSKRTLTPKLRFPEFQKEPGWKEKSVNAISDVNPNHEGLPDSFVYIDLESVEQGNLVAQKVINREGAPSRAQRLLRKRDVIYQTVRPYQRNNLFFDVEDDLDYVASTGYAQLRAHASPAFLFQLLHTNDFVNKVLAKCTGSNYPAINSSDLATIEVAVPSPSEQKEIAECLSSLDELIAAECRKLEALKAHKKGLMQQLFPQPGQTQPRLRFPEFQNKGEWEEKILSDACLMQAGKFVAASEIKEQDEEGLFPCYGGNGLRGFTSSRTHDGIYPLIGRQGALCGNVMLARGEFHATEHAVVASPRKGVDVIWLFYVLDQLNLNRFATGQAQPGLSVNVLANVNLAIPALEQEQHRIAACLTALDTRIAAQAAKIETLKQHKRGLMQQLFPALEEV